MTKTKKTDSPFVKLKRVVSRKWREVAKQLLSLLVESALVADYVRGGGNEVARGRILQDFDGPAASGVMIPQYPSMIGYSQLSWPPLFSSAALHPASF